MADPPWNYNFSKSKSRKVENHYPTMKLNEICELGKKINHIVDPNCILFLWSTAPKLLEAIQVMQSWNFTYKTCAIWDKRKLGMGYWFRGIHEMLLVGTKGETSPPLQENRFPSIFAEPRKKHSQKPNCIYSMIDIMFPSAIKLELFGRGSAKVGWDIWGIDAINSIEL